MDDEFTKANHELLNLLTQVRLQIMADDHFKRPPHETFLESCGRLHVWLEHKAKTLAPHRRM